MVNVLEIVVVVTARLDDESGAHLKEVEVGLGSCLWSIVQMRVGLVAHEHSSPRKDSSEAL